MKTLILGVGSSILTDDSVGLVVAGKLGERFAGRDDVDVGFNEEAGFSLLEESLGYDRLIVIDSILTGREPGTVMRLSLDDLGRTIHSNSPHGANLATVMELGRQQEMDVPGVVVIYAIEVVDVLTFGEELTPELAARVDAIADEIASEVFPEDGAEREPGRDAMSDELYRLPLYYDIAFSWDIEPEIEFFKTLFRDHVPFPVENILEPCCGAGRFLVAMPPHGYRMTGYDVSQEMLDYARGRVEEAGLSDSVELVRAEMQTARFERKFDAALNSINSLGYLLEDDDIVSHFRLTGEALKPGGIYIVHISCAHDGTARE